MIVVVFVLVLVLVFILVFVDGFLAWVAGPSADPVATTDTGTTGSDTGIITVPSVHMAMGNTLSILCNSCLIIKFRICTYWMYWMYYVY